MIYVACAISAVIAALVAFLVARSRQQERLSQAENRSAAAEARASELKEQVAGAQKDFEPLREKLAHSETERTVALARLEESNRNLAAQRELLEDAKARLTDTFKSLASDALAQSNKGFLTLAEQKFKALADEAKSDLESRRVAVAQLVEPLNKALADYQEQARGIEERRVKEISAVGEQLRSLAQAEVALRQETSQLVNALKSPQIRGRWGEIALRKTAELAGMSKHCDFVEQESVGGEGGRLRPDMVVRLPAGREVVVDSKVPLAGFMESLEATTDAARSQALARHAVLMKQHVAKLATKEYWNQFPTAPEFVVMFIPNDSFLAAAAESDPGLIENALTQNVVIATPTTFIALLRAVAFGWRQEVVAESAQKISLLGKEMSDRIATLASHIVDLGNSLSKSVDSYNSMVGSVETRLLTSARKFKELGAEGKKEIEEVRPIDLSLRKLTLIQPEAPADVPVAGTSSDASPVET
jgi:DNA recombination protein RmuC